MSILDKFLEIENNEKLYQYFLSYKETLMYPFIRFLLLESAIEDAHEIHSPYDPLNVGILKKINYVIKSFLYRPHKHIQSDIIFFGTDISNIRKGNVYFNRLTETFANEYLSKTVLIESADKMDYKRPRTYPKVFARNIFDIIAQVKSLSKSVNSKDLDNIDSFIQFLKQYFDYKFKSAEVWDNIKNVLISFAKKLPYLYNEYERLLKQLSPKIVFLEDACYGAGNVPLIMATKELKIPIGEYQHGLISLAHPAYNYSTQIANNYKRYMPDFYMSYGKYWILNSRLPIKVLEIGNPYLSDIISKQKLGVKKEQILYASSAISPEYYVNEVIWLKNNLFEKGYSVVFRIHPSETLRLKTVYRPIIDAGISIDTQPLYETLRNTKYIIGDMSTVIFEAAIFDCVIFARDTPFNRENIDISQFNIYHYVEELTEKILSKNYKKTDADIFWADNWRAKYRQIIDSYCQ